MLCTVFEILHHTFCKTLQTVFLYIRHIVQKGNLMQSQLKLDKHTDSHT